MAKKICVINSVLKISILILCLIAFTSEQIVWIDYQFNEEYAEKEVTNAKKEEVYALDLTHPEPDSKALNYYMKVTVTPKENNPTPQVLCRRFALLPGPHYSDSVDEYKGSL